MDLEAIRSFRAWMGRQLESWPGGVAPDRGDEYAAVIDGASALLEDNEGLWHDLPAIIRRILVPRGWEWNGIYRLEGERLVLHSAAGPPVCATLERRGGVGTSGMCFDSILMNQTVATDNVGAWPGYVSCDRESGLRTLAGMVCPIRDARGTPWAVWDLDATQPLCPTDPIFCDRLFATLSSVAPPPAARGSVEP